MLYLDEPLYILGYLHSLLKLPRAEEPEPELLEKKKPGPEAVAGAGARARAPWKKKSGAVAESQKN